MPPLYDLWSRRDNTLRREDLYGWCLQQPGVDGANATALLACVTDALLSRGTRLDPGETEWRASLSSTYAETKDFVHSLALLWCAFLVWFMQAGFCMLCAGAVRRKNIQNTLLKNLLDVSGAALAWYAVGYAFAFGGDNHYSSSKSWYAGLDLTTDYFWEAPPPDTYSKTTFMGRQNFFMVDLEPNNYILWFFECSFGAAATTIIAGTLAERCQMAAYLYYAIVLAGWVYPIVAHAVWSHHGWLSAYNTSGGTDVTGSSGFRTPLFGVGMVDFAGAGVVHLTGGVTALLATVILGPRRGRFHDETGRRLDTPKEFPGHDMSLQMLGTIILWFGWYGFNMGSALMGDRDRSYKLVALTAVNTTLSGGAAGVTSLLLNYYLLDRYTGEPYFDLKHAMYGSLCGLAAVTGGCGVMEPYSAIITGFVAGLLYRAGSKALLYFRLDDAVDCIPIHGISGCWGLIAVGLFASPRYLEAAYGHARHPGWVYSWGSPGGSDATLLGAQLCGILFIIGWVTVNMFPFFIWLDWKGWFRSEAMEEIVGLDRSFHGGLALLAGDEVVRAEYITAYRKKKEEGGLRKRRSRLKGQFDTDSLRFELVDLARSADDNVDDSSSVFEGNDDPMLLLHDDLISRLDQ